MSAGKMSGATSIVGVGLTKQARNLDASSTDVCLEAAFAALKDAGLRVEEIDGIAGRWHGPGGTIFHPGSSDWGTLLGVPLAWIDDSYPAGVPAVLNAAAAIAGGFCSTVLILGGQAGLARGGSVASYTRPGNEFVAPWGAFTAAQFALMAQAYVHRYGTDWADVAAVAATVRNMGAMNPEAVMYQRGPYTAAIVLAAPKIASPFTLLDVCLANDGGAAIVVTSAERARDLRRVPVDVLGCGTDWYQQQYVTAPRLDEVHLLGRRAAKQAFGMAGVSPADVDVASVYDATSFEIVRQYEALGFCDPGEGPAFAREAGIGVGGGLPTNPDGGLLSASHIGLGAPTLRVIEAVRQLRGEAAARQVSDAEIAIATGAGSAAQYHNTLVLGRGR